MIFVINRGKVIQVFAAALAGSFGFFAGLYIGWTSPMTTYFTSKDTKLQSGPMTREEISLMSSLMYIGAIVGALTSGWLVNRIGRKWTILIWFFPQIVANVLILIAKSPLLLLISRTLCGTVIGVVLVVASIFTAEVVDDSLKTTVGTFIGIIYNTGLFFSKFLTGSCGIYAVPIASIPITFLFIVCWIICPDTPEYLLFRGKVDEAEKSLRFYRGLSLNQPLPEPIALELEKIKKEAKLRGDKTSTNLKDFSESTTILAIVISFVLTGCLNFTGIRITPAFTEAIIKDSGIQVDLSLVDTSISSLQIIGCLTSIYITQRFGVRLPLLVYFVIAFLALFGTGIHYYLHYSYDIDLNPITWSFLVFLGISIVIPTTCLNNICISVPSMILPLKIRGSVLGILSVLHMVVAVFLMHYYLYLVDAIGSSTIFTAFSIWCLFGAIFSYCFIPEVSKIAYSEIVSLLNGKLPERFRSS